MKRIFTPIGGAILLPILVILPGLAEQGNLIRFEQKHDFSEKCMAAIMRVEDNLINRAVLHSSYTREENHPQQRGTKKVIFGITGSIGRKVMFASQLLTDLAKDAFLNCEADGVSSITFGYWGSGHHYSFGRVNNVFEIFKCIEDLTPDSPRSFSAIIPWGYTYCNI